MAAQRGFDQICPDDLLQKLRKQYDGWWFIDKDCKEYNLLEDEEEEEQEEQKKKKKSRMWENAMEETYAKQSRMWENAMEETYAKPFWS